MNIDQTVKALVKRFGTANPFKICELLSVILVIKPLIDSKGVYKYFERNIIICIDSKLSYTEQLFVCAHELGHAIMHTKINTFFLKNYTFFSTDHYEIEANEFAKALIEIYVNEYGGDING